MLSTNKTQEKSDFDYWYIIIRIILLGVSIISYHLWVKYNRAKAVNEFRISPNCDSVILPCISSFNQLTAKDSCTFDKTQVRAISLRLSAVEQGILLGILFILYCLHILGKYISLNESLNISVNGTANTQANSFRIFNTGSLGPGALLILILIRWFWTSSTLTFGRLSKHSTPNDSFLIRG